jgi:hypothetical protein
LRTRSNVCEINSNPSTMAGQSDNLQASANNENCNIAEQYL